MMLPPPTSSSCCSGWDLGAEPVGLTVGYCKMLPVWFTVEYQQQNHPPPVPCHSLFTDRSVLGHQATEFN